MTSQDLFWPGHSAQVGPQAAPTYPPCGSHSQAAKSPPPQGEQTQEPPRGDFTCRGGWPRLSFWLQLPFRGFGKGGPGRSPSSYVLELGWGWGAAQSFRGSNYKMQTPWPCRTV